MDTVIRWVAEIELPINVGLLGSDREKVYCNCLSSCLSVQIALGDCQVTDEALLRVAGYRIAFRIHVFPGPNYSFYGFVLRNTEGSIDKILNRLTVGQIVKKNYKVTEYSLL